MMRTAGWLLLVGCSEPVLDLAPDAERTGLDGLHGPYGAAHQTFRANVRVSDVMRYEVSWPANATGDYAENAGSCPVIGFVHGGFVGADQYRWMHTHFASRGYCVVSPEHELKLAIMESDHVSLALDELQDRPPKVLSGAIGEQAVVMGHSLGGAVGSFRWVGDDRFQGLALLASWPSEGTDVESLAGRPSISLIGSEDKAGKATKTAFEEYARFPDPAWFGVIDGMNHYDWADGATDRELAGDGTPTRPREETRRDAKRVLDAWLDAYLRNDAEAQAALQARAFPDVRAEP